MCFAWPLVVFVVLYREIDTSHTGWSRRPFHLSNHWISAQVWIVQWWKENELEIISILRLNNQSIPDQVHTRTIRVWIPTHRKRLLLKVPLNRCPCVTVNRRIIRFSLLKWVDGDNNLQNSTISVWNSSIEALMQHMQQANKIVKVISYKSMNELITLQKTKTALCK